MQMNNLMKQSYLTLEKLQVYIYNFLNKIDEDVSKQCRGGDLNDGRQAPNSYAAKDERMLRCSASCIPSQSPNSLSPHCLLAVAAASPLVIQHGAQQFIMSTV
jgi:hypothetical protein